MFGIGMPELAVIIVVALVVLGPKRLPEVARSLGKGLAEFRRLTGDVNKELDAARHMIESEACEHENERRRADREARSSTAEIQPADQPADQPTDQPADLAADQPTDQPADLAADRAAVPAPNTQPAVAEADPSRKVESPVSAQTGSTTVNPPSTPADKEPEG